MDGSYLRFRWEGLGRLGGAGLQQLQPAPPTLASGFTLRTSTLGGVDALVMGMLGLGLLRLGRAAAATLSVVARKLSTDADDSVTEDSEAESSSVEDSKKAATSSGTWSALSTAARTPCVEREA